MKTSIKVATTVVAIALYSAALAAAFSYWGPEGHSPVTTFVVAAIVGSGAAVGFGIKRVRERRHGTGAQDGVERDDSLRAQAAAFIDVLVAAIALVAVLVIFPQWISGTTALVILVVFALADFWMRYAIRVKSAE
ncbi:hypothetical protein D9V32_02235 [Mycetocola tolaasinivorans]|uniref:DUF2178 domain-containing protein n=1 Tax=Mycetocola tolaasinivorans TaxID=76635 RepID=A0A3L7AAG1_9MICO|nr:hypothetical protein [Mycetocola tolaasinivorans]RLP77293.1 hypothetical protein D9V32_02235 [Mycetocola tolaasinivorans]